MVSAAVPLPRFSPPPLAPLKNRTLAIAFGVSLAVHALLLCLRFAFPEKFSVRDDAQLEVVLVNSKTTSRPDKPRYLAQANLDGGGNTDADRHASTPLPAMPDSQSQVEVRAQAARMKALEEEQRMLITQLKHGPKIAVSDTAAKDTQPSAEPTQEINGQELAMRALALAQLEAKIARQQEDYEKRPKRKFVGSRAVEARFAQYVDEFREKVERFGSSNYPNDARGRVYGSLRLTVSIKADGSLEGVELDRSSGHKVLDDAAQRIVYMASPFGRFPPEMKKDTDIIVITRTWYFERGDHVRGAVQ